MITHIPNHAEEALSRLLGYQAEYSNLRSIVTLLCEGIQEIEDLLYTLINDTTIEMATGATLDMWGSLLGEPRDGLSDGDYRKFIYARAATRNSAGKAETILYILSIIASYPERVLHVEFPGTARFEYVTGGDTSLSRRRRISSQVKQATSAGVAVNVVEAPVGYFGFAGNSEARGFGVGRLARRIDDD